MPSSSVAQFEEDSAAQRGSCGRIPSNMALVRAAGSAHCTNAALEAVPIFGLGLAPADSVVDVS